VALHSICLQILQVLLKKILLRPVSFYISRRLLIKALSYSNLMLWIVWLGGDTVLLILKFGILLLEVLTLARRVHFGVLEECVLLLLPVCEVAEVLDLRIPSQ
jgi:hypothetical protein